MGSMAKKVARVLRPLIALAAVAVAALTAPGSVADETATAELQGACYCRGGGQLMCTANLTGRECALRCRQALCDEWFWKERLPCWNWGYGG
jgi:hypothetical protein